MTSEPTPPAEDDPFATPAPFHVEQPGPNGGAPVDDHESFETAIPVRASLNGKDLPHSDEIESAFLGACFTDETPHTAEQAIASGLSREHFFNPGYAAVFSCVSAMLRDGLPLDVAALSARLGPRLGELGGQPFLSRIFSSSSTTLHAAQHARAIRSLSDRRSIIRDAELMRESAYDLANPVEEIASLASARLATVNRPSTFRPFQMWRLSQFIDYKSDPSACLLGDGFVEKGEWTSLVGIGGIGKTRLALYFAICQIIGREFCGLTVGGSPQNISIFSTENGIRRWSNDASKMYAQLTDDQRALCEKHIFAQALTRDDDGDLCMGNPETVGRLEATLLDTKPGIVIFDPFADMVEGDENKTSDLVQTLRTLRSLTRAGCPSAAGIIIHHARTGALNVAQAGDNFNAGNFGRGSKALYSRVRCELQLAPQDRDDSNRLVLACGKANNTTKFSTRGIIFDPETFAYSVDPSFDVDEWRSDVSGNRRKTSFSIKSAAEIIQENTTFSGQEISLKTILEIAEKDAVSRATVCRVLKQGQEAGYFRKGKERGCWMLGSKPITS